MFLSDDERKALMRVGELIDRRGHFDKCVAFQGDKVAILRSLQDKGLISRQHEQYYLTRAGMAELHNARQVAQERIERTRENRHEKRHNWMTTIVGVLLGGFLTWLLSLLVR